MRRGGEKRGGKCGARRGMPEEPLALLSPGIIIGIFIISPRPRGWRGGVFLVPGGLRGGGRAGPEADLECAEHP